MSWKGGLMTINGKPNRFEASQKRPCARQLRNLECRRNNEVSVENSSYLGRLRGKRILFIEEEYFLTDETRIKLAQLGAVVVGPVSTLTAFALIDIGQLDAAVLDIHLDGQFAFVVSEELERNDIGFVFATSHTPKTLPAQFSGFALCEETAELEKISAALFVAAKDGKLH
jgi:hypothetical protein